METYAVTLRPQGSHLGPITSQTLFGAVCWALDTLRLTDVTHLLAGFELSPRFIFSSAFPFIEGPHGLVRFLPKPALPLISMSQIHHLAKGDRRRIKELVSIEAKQVKKASYVSAGLFSEICAGRWDGLSLVREWGGRLEKVGNAIWLERERQQIWGRASMPDSLWRQADVQRNAIDRVAGATAEGLLFHESQTFYRPAQAGLWFVARADAEAWGWLQAAFRYLADTGLGGKRAVGKGHFDFTWQVAPDLLPYAPDADSFVALSPYLPRFEQDQIEATPRSYNLQVIRQKAENKFPGSEQMQIYSGGLRLFSEGSIFTLPEKRESYGQIVALGQVNGRQVYYNGLTVPAFAKLGGVVQ